MGWERNRSDWFSYQSHILILGSQNWSKQRYSVDMYEDERERGRESKKSIMKKTQLNTNLSKYYSVYIY
jgi:hypothetical protein